MEKIDLNNEQQGANTISLFVAGQLRGGISIYGKDEEGKLIVKNPGLKSVIKIAQMAGVSQEACFKAIEAGVEMNKQEKITAEHEAIVSEQESRRLAEEKKLLKLAFQQWWAVNFR
jgi:hypothetical protein